MHMIIDDNYKALEALCKIAPNLPDTKQLMAKVVSERAYLRSAGLVIRRFDFYQNMFDKNA